jgi:hypothetical protein
MKDLVALLHFTVIRWLERRLSVPALYRALQPIALVGGPGRQLFRKQFHPLPAFLARSTRVSRRQQRRTMYLNEILEFFPERLGTAKWMDRCRFAGLEQLQQARQNGRSIVLAFWHCGPYSLLRFWLRAAGIPAVTLIQGRAEDRSRWKRIADQVSPFPEIPTALYQDQLKETLQLLEAGSPLLIAVDGAAGKQMNVPAHDNWIFKMASGPVRLAIRHQAELFPCKIVDEGAWRFRLEIGKPAPAEFLFAESAGVNAGKYLFDELYPQLQAHPDYCSRKLLKRFQQEPLHGIQNDVSRALPFAAR